jgi:hypothetical protein
MGGQFEAEVIQASQRAGARVETCIWSLASPSSLQHLFRILKPLAHLFSIALVSYHFSHLPTALRFCCPMSPNSSSFPDLLIQGQRLFKVLKINFSLPQGELLLSDEASHPQ